MFKPEIQNYVVVGQLTAFKFVYLYYGSVEKVCYVNGPPMFAAPVAGASVRCGGYCK